MKVKNEQNTSYLVLAIGLLSIISVFISTFRRAYAFYVAYNVTNITVIGTEPYALLDVGNNVSKNMDRLMNGCGSNPMPIHISWNENLSSCDGAGNEVCTTISSVDSPYPVYFGYYEGSSCDEYYIHSPVNMIYLNPDSSNLFSFESIFHRGAEIGQDYTTKIRGNNIVSYTLPFNTSLVTNFSHAFANVGKAPLDIGNWNTSNVTNMSYMFQSTTFSIQDGIVSVDPGNCTYEVNGLYGMANLNNWDTSNVTDMSGMFTMSTFGNYTYNIPSSMTDEWVIICGGEPVINIGYPLNLSNWNTVNVTNMSHLFAVNTYSAPDTFAISDSWNTSNVTDMSYMFYGMPVNTNNIKNINTTKVTNMAYMFASTTLKSNSTTYKSNLSELKFDTGNVTNMKSMFQGVNVNFMTGSSFAEFANIGYNTNVWNTSKVTDMSQMFWQANLANINASRFNTARVNNMGNMFKDARKLTILNINGWDTKNVLYMDYMFSNTNISILNVYNFNTSKVTTMNGMFYKANKVSELNLGNWNVQSVTNFINMFNGMTVLSSLSTYSWNIRSTTTTAQMYQGLSNLNYLNMGNSNLTGVTNMYRMFYGTSNLATFDFSANLASVSNVTGMFTNSFASQAQLKSPTYIANNITINLEKTFYYIISPNMSIVSTLDYYSPKSTWYTRTS